MIPVDPRRVPKLAEMPYGYRHLGYCQALLGHTVLRDLPEAKGEESDRLYLSHIAWLEGKGKDELDRMLKIKRA
ncbi:uncharacterized protein IL334_007447 [Kwoniella shivajii]|uniref:Uncharacterized protein n=1 Tax=Kwoniella shivajii TaxID=564305 RepID=A0ABZ1D8N9_9TREE|nr:hypothetical protein IL334_007447 [Kwoniella shivajii]